LLVCELDYQKITWIYLLVIELFLSQTKNQFLCIICGDIGNDIGSDIGIMKMSDKLQLSVIFYDISIYYEKKSYICINWTDKNCN
jgi:hypothetical protein